LVGGIFPMLRAKKFFGSSFWTSSSRTELVSYCVSSWLKMVRVGDNCSQAAWENMTEQSMETGAIGLAADRNFKPSSKIQILDDFGWLGHFVW
jgi:hypothetical protein